MRKYGIALPQMNEALKGLLSCTKKAKQAMKRYGIEFNLQKRIKR